MKIEKREISREEVVRIFGEEKVSEYERNKMLGIERPLVKKEKVSVLNVLKIFLAFVALFTALTLVYKFFWIFISGCLIVSGVKTYMEYRKEKAS